MASMQYWAEIRRVQASLPAGDAHFIVSIGPAAGHTERVAGRITETDSETAAKCIVEGSHRLATPEEIAEHHLATGRVRRAQVSAEATRIRNARHALDQRSV